MADREKGGPWVAVCAALFYPFTWAVTRWRCHSAPQIPRRGPVLLVLNHVSHLDPIVDAVFVHRHKRVPRFLAKAEVVQLPIFGRLFHSAGTIPVYRGTRTAGDALREAHQALQDGKVVVIYPEGTITKDPDGWPKNTYTGVARLALANDVTVLPAARWGTNLILDGYRKKFRPFPRKTVEFTVGEPMDLSAYRSRQPDNETLREVTDVLMNEVIDLLCEIRGEQPPTRPDAGTESV